MNPSNTPDQMQAETKEDKDWIPKIKFIQQYQKACYHTLIDQKQIKEFIINKYKSNLQKQENKITQRDIVEYLNQNFPQLKENWTDNQLFNAVQKILRENIDKQTRQKIANFNKSFKDSQKQSQRGQKGGQATAQKNIRSGQEGKERKKQMVEKRGQKLVSEKEKKKIAQLRQQTDMTRKQIAQKINKDFFNNQDIRTNNGVRNSYKRYKRQQD